MKIRLPKHIESTPTRRLSTRVMYALVLLTALVFGAFYLIGCDIPYDEDPSLDAPLLTDAVLGVIYLFLIVAAVLAVGSCVKGIRAGDSSDSVVNNIPVARITALISVFTVLCIAVTFLLGSSEPLLVNGVKYADAFWLKTTDMLISTIGVLLFVAVCGAVFGLSGYNRKIKLRSKGRL